MKKIFALFVTFLSLNSMAALLEGKDLSGRLMIIDQSTGAVQGIIQVRKATSQDNALGSLAVQVDQLVIKGKTLSGTCTGDFNLEDQTLMVLCNKNSDVLSLKLNTSNEDIVSYLKGSFATGELSYGSRPAQSHTEKFTVDIKNLDLK